MPNMKMRNRSKWNIILVMKMMKYYSYDENDEILLLVREIGKM